MNEEYKIRNFGQPNVIGRDRAVKWIEVSLAVPITLFWIFFVWDSFGGSRVGDGMFGIGSGIASAFSVILIACLGCVLFGWSKKIGWFILVPMMILLVMWMKA